MDHREYRIRIADRLGTPYLLGIGVPFFTGIKASLV